MNNPLVSIIIPTYNRAHLIRETLDSIVAQTYKQWECIIVDDNSSDDTDKLIDEYLKRDTRFKYFKNDRKKGAQGARNKGLLSANAEWVVFFDSDDCMHTEFLEKLVTEALNKNVEVYTCFSNVIIRTTNKKQNEFNWVCKGNIHKGLLSGKVYVDYNGALIKKNKLIEIGLLDEDCPSFQEWDTHLRLSKVANYSTIEECLVNYYVGGDDAISSDKKRTINGYLYILHKHKNEWIENDEISFNNYGNIVYQLIEKVKETEFRKSKKKELFAIFPYLKNQLYKRNFQKRVKLFIPSIVLLIYKKIRFK